MSPTLRRKLEALAERHEELARLLAQPEIAGDASRYGDLSREYTHLGELTGTWQRYRAAEDELAQAHSLQDDPELGAMAREDIERLFGEQADLEAALQVLLLPRDPHDTANLYLEVRAGTGGDEAALFAGDLLRMYLRYAENSGWKAQILSAHEGERGGYKEAVALVEGKNAYARLKFESGTHRVQRVPKTESGGRIHTSAATVAILPQVEDIEEVPIDPADVRTDTFRASGAGGQHVNKTDSAIRLTHLPSGIVVECQDERSQHKNRARALSLLKARLLDQAQSQQAAEQAENRRLQVGSGDRSQRIRTYNFPQARVTDHRINLTLYRLDAVLQGDLDELVDALTREQQAEALQAGTE
jgi:peptide chain release factor 1